MSKEILPTTKSPSEKTFKVTNAELIRPHEEYILGQLAIGKTSKKIEAEFGWSEGCLYFYGEKYIAFRDKAHRARIAGMHSLVDQLQTIPEEIQDVNRARLMCENIRWTASRLDRQTYGDKVDVTMTHSVDLDSAMSEAQRRVEEKKRQLIEFAGQTVDAEVIEEEEESIFD
jgi:hypothetical protein